MRGLEQVRWFGIRMALSAAALILLAGCSEDSTTPPALQLEPAWTVLERGDSTGVIEVRNAGGGSLSWSLSTDASWLSLDRTSGSTDSSDPVTFYIVEDSLAVGEPRAQINASSDGGSAAATVQMWTDLYADLDTLDFGEETETRDLILTNAGTHDLSWSAVVDGEWLSLDQNAGDLAPGEDTLTVSVVRAGLLPGDYAGAITVQAGAYGRDTLRAVMVVPNHGTISGTIYYAETLIPIPDVLVSAGGRTATTGEDGGYLLTRVPLGSQVLIAEKEGFDSIQETVELGTAGLLLDLTMHTDTEIFDLVGMITNALGDPIDRASVTLLNPDGSPTTIATESAEGFYTLPNVPPGTHQIRYMRGLYQSLVSSAEVTGTGSEHNVQMIADPLIPPNPREEGPYVERITCASIEVRWSPSLLENLPTTAGYRVERSSQLGGPFIDVSGLVTGRTETRFLDDVTDLGTFYYRMRTENIDGLLGEPSTARKATIRPWIEFGDAAGGPGERHGHRAVYAPNPDRMIVIGGVGCSGGT